MAIAMLGKGVLATIILSLTHMCSETRAAHKLSMKLNREIIIGGTTLDTPSEFLEHLKVRQTLLLVVLKCAAWCAHSQLLLARTSAMQTSNLQHSCLQELGNGPEYSALEVDQGNGWS